jgi:hypothetical protein
MARYIITNEPEKINFEIGADGQARAVQNAKNLLMLKMGEIPYNRQRGFDHRLYDLPMGEIQGLLMEELDRVFLWEPYVEAVEAEILRMEESRVIIQVTIEVSEGAEA